MKITILILRLIIIVNITIITITTSHPTDIRCCHGSTVANNKLYIGGGITGPADNENFTDDFFSLDLTVPFSTLLPNDMPYQVNPNVLVRSNAHTLVYAVNKEGGMIYFFGGFRSEPKGSAIYGYSLELNAWSPVTPSGDAMPVESTTRIVGVTDSSLNTIYIFDNATMHIFSTFIEHLDISRNLAPYQIYYYAAAMLSTDEIAYIGGGKSNNKQDNIPMSQILLYNTKISTWYTKNARVAGGGAVPEPRKGHSASIAPDGRIFVYGGFDGDETAAESVGVNPVFAVLEYVNDEFVWSVPELFGQLYQFRIYHTSHVIGNNLIISFGRNLTLSRLNTIDIIDISDRNNYKAITDYVPPDYVSPTPSPSPSPSSSSSSSKGIIVASVCASLGALIIIGGTFYYLKRYRYRNVIPTPPSGERI